MEGITVQGLQQRCSQLVLGTSFFRRENKDLVFELLDTYVTQGGNVLDTSCIYGAGQSEEVIAMWLKVRQNRKNMVIISKGGHHYVDEQGRHHPEKKRDRPEFITQDLLESLKRTGVSYFDIYLIHRDDPDVPVGELIDMLEEHKKAGLIKVYGVSNWSIERIEEANKYAASKNYAGIAVNSPSFSLAKANESRWVGCVYADEGYLDWHKKSQLPFFPWAAQASGFFTGNFTPQNITHNPEITKVYYNDDNWERLKKARWLAAQKGDNYTANQIALAYVLNQPFPVCAIIGAQKTVHLIASLQAKDIKLTEQEILWLESKKVL